jgi:NADH-quinone oxidoreductase subunit L
MPIDKYLIWIPLFPLIGAAINLLVGRKLSRRAVHTVSVSAVLGSFIVTVFVLKALYQGWVVGHDGALGHSHVVKQVVFQWIAAGNVNINFGLMADNLTGVMLFVVTFVGFLIHVYSTGYMSHDTDYARFFGYLNLFTGAMLMLVLGDNLIVMFVGWEGVGLCSYLLIGFWYDKSGTKAFGLENANAGKKAFIVNRIGDLAFIVGMFILFAAAGTLDFAGLEQAAAAGKLSKAYGPFGLGPYTIAGVAALFLFIGATGKSAQIPLFVWLPDAMAGPTPVSALIHAATMVTAGVYMVARLNFIYMLTPTVMGIVALIGALTALFAATIGFAQNDIKKVLAYSTVSQLGYMFVGVGMGAYAAGIFHVFTHAFFKACLFLGAGAVIHALHDEQDIRKMGGLAGKLKYTMGTFLVSTLAIAGIFPFAGFFSKDEILWKAFSTLNASYGPTYSMVIYVLGMAAAFCTAFYMFRLFSLTFLGKTRMSSEDYAHIHAPGPAMVAPLIVLALFAAVIGFLGLPGVIGHGHYNFFHNWLGPVVDRGSAIAANLGIANRVFTETTMSHNAPFEWGLMALSFAVAVGSSWIAWKAYRDGPSQPIHNAMQKIGPIYRLVLDKYRIDELYFVLVVWPVKKLAWVLWRIIDFVVIDFMGVNIIGAKIVDLFGGAARRVQNGNLQHYVVGLLAGVAVIVFFISRPPAAFEVTPKKRQVNIGQTVTFNADNHVKADKRQLVYRWDLDGDHKWDVPKGGKWGTSTMVTRAYDKSGKKKVILEVRDKRWKTTRRFSRTILVVDPNAVKKPKAGKRGKQGGKKGGVH